MSDEKVVEFEFREVEVARTFQITKEQLEKSKAWQREHGCQNGPICHRDPVSPWSLHFTFKPDSVCDTVIVQCTQCQETLDITDYDNI